MLKGCFLNTGVKLVFLCLLWKLRYLVSKTYLILCAALVSYLHLL
uniref:Uncharacterized protein n=1 Tax=Arundo donax TaxID=35708 RepID=A0A0A9HVL1_ARUDO